MLVSAHRIPTVKMALSGAAMVRNTACPGKCLPRNCGGR
jgi:hypothetical protein